MREYVSLIIDIENSRVYSPVDRNNIQGLIVETIKCLNKVFDSALEFCVAFSAGDEVQGLFRDITSAVLYLRIFEMMLSPVKIRAGFGIGEWNIKIEHGVSTQQDGPAYHRGREAIEAVRKTLMQRYRINSDNDNALINNLLNASYVLKEQQGDMQNIVLIIMELLYPFEKKGSTVYDYNTIKGLIEMKYNYCNVMNSSSTLAGKLNRKVKIQNSNTESLKIVEPIFIDGINFDSEKIIIKKNMSKNIAAIVDSTRQNVDMLIKRGNSIIIRNMDYIALQYIEREYGERHV